MTTKSLAALFSVALAILGLCFGEAFAAEPAGPIRVLILSGRNNHDWRQTTPALQRIYRGSDRFVADVTEDPAKCTADVLAGYDVVVGNWCAWPDVNGRQWGPQAEKAFVDFVRSGKGFALFHAAAATLHNWPEYQQMIGATWKLGTTGHGRIHSFKVTITDEPHPVTRGMPDFLIRDELWHRMGTQPNIEVLCEAFSSKDSGGSGRAEPVVICTKFGKGRCFYNILGHDAKTIQNTAWQTLMLRGTEWAATGRVTIPVPDNRPTAPAEAQTGYQWRQTDSSLALVKDGKVVWQLNFDKKQGKPYFHPVCLTDGTQLTWHRPPDHPWHRALWFSWKHINGLNYWEEDRNTGLSQGRGELTDIKATPHDDHSAKIAMTLAYHPPDKPPVLTEERLINVSAPDEQGRYRIDWLSTFTAGDEDVLLDRTPIPGEKDGKGWGGYAGLSVRIAKDISNWQVIDSEGRKQTQAHGKKARWMDFAGRTPDGKEAGIAIFDHPGNLRHPSPWYVSMDTRTPFGYFSPAILFDKPYTLPAAKSLTLRYRILIHPGSTDKNLLEAEWKTFGKMAANKQALPKQTASGKGLNNFVPGLARARALMKELRARRSVGKGPNKGVEFLGLDLSGAAKTSNLAELSELFASDPADPNKHRVRKDVVLARHPEHWAEGVVYYAAAKSHYYILLEPGHPGRKVFYGPFDGKPWKHLAIAEPKPTKDKHRFAIYLVADPIDAGRPDQVALEQLHLATEPIITENDLLGYDWKQHILKLAPGVRHNVPSPGAWGIPFVVVADGRRCYLGVFWGHGSSYMPKSAVAYVGSITVRLASKDSISIEAPPIAGGKDPRSDPRIRKALEALNFVEPEKSAQRPKRIVMSLEKALQVRVDVSHWTRQTPFGEAIEDLKNSVDPPLPLIVLWRDLYDNAEIDRQTPISMDGISDVPLGTALSFLLMAVTGNPTQLGYVIDGSVITVATKDSLQTKWKTRVYDISDLL